MNLDKLVRRLDRALDEAEASQEAGSMDIEQKAIAVREMAKQGEIPPHLEPDLDGAMHYVKRAMSRRSRRLYEADMATCEEYLDRILSWTHL